ncbi:hypothetical protein [Arthrobacter dokdonensis]|uniref:hypothetical protein n=1 Tax=Arthrobacter dokdonellae TaxID=2211210 RepID=UPI000DE5C2AD|nr:hypothetical protein [Arthrobacter dokdonellae]
MTFLWIVLTAAVACLGGWPLTAGVLRLAKSHSVRAADAHELHAGDPEGARHAAADLDDGAPPAAPAAPPAPDAGVLRGGLLIGVLERAAVVLAILAGQPVAIAYVVAIKGLGRYPELKQAPAASERFIIGTLASLLWAAVVACAAKALLL